MKIIKSTICFILTCSLVIGIAINAWACTGIYVGKKLTTTGNTYVGRSEDISQYYNKLYFVVPAETHSADEIWEDEDGFSIPYPTQTYRYTGVFDTPVDWDGYDMAYAEVGMNENGVSVSATVSTSYNSNAKATDRLVNGGITEMSLTSIILMSANSAREGVEILAGIIDEYGSGECNSLVISDSNETWFMEIVSGHQYAAIKMPDDVIAVVPNTIVMGAIDVSDTDNVIVSKNLVSLAESNGFLVTEDGKIHIAKTYGTTFSANSKTRIYQGRYYFNSALADALDMNSTYIDMFFRPTGKVSALDAMKLLGFRGEGTNYDSNVDSSIRAIGTNGQAECHIFEINSNAQTELATVQWLAMSRAEYSLYIPTYSNLLTETLENYYEYTQTYNKSDTYAYDNNSEEFYNSMYWIFCKLNDLCDDDRNNYGTNVRTFLDNYQSALIEQQYIVNEGMTKVYKQKPDVAEKIATGIARYVAAEALSYAQELVAELGVFIASNSDGEFIPTLLTDDVQPTYAEYFALLADKYGIVLTDASGGESSETSQISSSDENQDSSDNNSGDSESASSTGPSGDSGSSNNSPSTGDSIVAFTFIIIILSAACLIVFYRRRKQLK